MRDARRCSSSIRGHDAARTARDASRASFDRAERSDANDALDVFSARFRRARDDIAETAFVELREVIFFICFNRVRPSIDVRRELVGCGARVFARIVSHSPQKRRGEGQVNANRRVARDIGNSRGGVATLRPHAPTERKAAEHTFFTLRKRDDDEQGQEGTRQQAKEM